MTCPRIIVPYLWCPLKASYLIYDMRIKTMEEEGTAHLTPEMEEMF